MEIEIELGDLFDEVCWGEGAYRHFVAMAYASGMRNRHRLGTDFRVRRFTAILEAKMRWFVNRSEKSLKYRHRHINIVNIGLEEMNKAATVMALLSSIPNKGPDADECNDWVRENLLPSKRLETAILKTLGTSPGSGCKNVSRNTGKLCGVLPVNDDGHCDSRERKEDTTCTTGKAPGTPIGRPRKRGYDLSIEPYRDRLLIDVDYKYILKISRRGPVLVAKLVDGKEVSPSGEDVKIASEMGLIIEERKQ